MVLGTFSVNVTRVQKVYMKYEFRADYGRLLADIIPNHCENDQSFLMLDGVFHLIAARLADSSIILFFSL